MVTRHAQNSDVLAYHSAALSHEDHGLALLASDEAIVGLHTESSAKLRKRQQSQGTVLAPLAGYEPTLSFGLLDRAINRIIKDYKYLTFDADDPLGPLHII